MLLMAIWLFLPCCVAGEGEEEIEFPPPEIHFHYPKDGGTIFALPHVLLIFDVEKAFFLPDRITLEIDGREIDEEAVKGCAVCAGDKPALLSAKVPWGMPEGMHREVVTASPPEGAPVRKEITYLVDSTIPSLSGLSGFVTFPGAHVAGSSSLRGGFVHDDLDRGDFRLWLMATRLLVADEGTWWALPFEAGVSARLPEKGSQEVTYSLKVGIIEQKTRLPAVSVGVRDNDPYAVVGWRLSPARFSVSAGVGAGDLPGAFVGAEYGPEIFRLVAEYGSGGILNGGVVIHHPYGVRLGIYNVERERDERDWTVQLSGSFGF